MASTSVKSRFPSCSAVTARSANSSTNSFPNGLDSKGLSSLVPYNSFRFSGNLWFSQAAPRYFSAGRLSLKSFTHPGSSRK